MKRHMEKHPQSEDTDRRFRESFPFITIMRQKRWETRAQTHPHKPWQTLKSSPHTEPTCRSPNSISSLKNSNNPLLSHCKKACSGKPRTDSKKHCYETLGVQGAKGGHGAVRFHVSVQQLISTCFDFILGGAVNSGRWQLPHFHINLWSRRAFSATVDTSRPWFRGNQRTKH